MTLPESRTDLGDFDFYRPPNEADVEEEMTSRDVIVDLLLARTLSPKDKAALAAGAGLTLVLAVPSAEWVKPTVEALRNMSDDAYVIGRETVPKKGEDDHLVDRLMSGRPVVGVSQSPETMLPKLLIDTVERRLSLARIDHQVIEKVLRRFQRGPVPRKDLRLLELVQLGLNEVSSLISTGGTATATVQRLERVLRARVQVGPATARLPALEDAIEYGDARNWALSLRDDILDYRNGRIKWSDVDRGCVLHGPPGTGKTLLAKMIGATCEVPTIVTSLADLFVSGTGYLDSVLKQQRAMFEQARAKAPSILFLDEVNALPDPNVLEGKNRDYWMPVVLDFYTQLDGALSDREGVVVVGATNRIEDLNSAILRPGRLERAIYVGPPNCYGVERIMRFHLGGALADVDLGTLARIGAQRGVTGAVIMDAVRGARRSARRENRPMVIDDLERQLVPPDTRTIEQTRRTAIHEAGHAIASMCIGDALTSISILPLGVSGGSTQFTGEGWGHRTLRGVENLVVVLLAGRAAEELVLGAPSLGAGCDPDSDLAQATELLCLAHGSAGLGDSLLYRGVSSELRQLLTIDREFRMSVELAMARLQDVARACLLENRHVLLRLVEELLVKKFLTGEEVRSLLKVQ